MLKVLVAAIMDENGGIHVLPRPYRHHNIIRKMRDCGYSGSVKNQGFLLTDGRFADRKESEHVAITSGQLRGGRTIGGSLTSEDIW